MVDTEKSFVSSNTKLEKHKERNPQEQQQLDQNMSTMLDMGFTTAEANEALNFTNGGGKENFNIPLPNLKKDKQERKAKKIQKSVSFKEEASICKVQSIAEVPSQKNIMPLIPPDELQEGESSKNAEFPIGKNKSDTKQRDKKSGRQKGVITKTSDGDYIDHHNKPAPATLFDFVQEKFSDTFIDEVEEVESAVTSAAETNVSASALPQALRCNNNRPAGPPSNLPPRLQKKQMREEMERVTGKKYSLQDDANIGQKQYDVNSRGPVSNRNLWTSQKQEEEDKKTTPLVPPEKVKSSQKVQNLNNNVHKELVAGSVQVLQRSLQPIKINSNQEERTKVNGQNRATTSLNETQRVPHVNSNDVKGSNNSKKFIWKSGDNCLAKWKDNQFYPARVVKPMQNKVIVEFYGYPGNETINYENIMQHSPMNHISQPNYQFNNQMPPNNQQMIYPHAPILYHHSQADIGSMGGMVFQPGNPHMMLNPPPNYIFPYPNHQVPSIYPTMPLMPEQAARHRPAPNNHPSGFNQNNH